jgi:hypothetical protein
MADFKSGARGSATPQRLPPKFIIAVARAASDAEIQEAAEYFSRLRPRSPITVIETDTVPGTYVANWFLAVDKAAASEPVGQRIIEVPEDLEQFERRDSRARFLAYVPFSTSSPGRVPALPAHR